MSRLKLIALVVGLGLVIGLGGCSKLSTKNFDKIHPGMTLGQVEKILGKDETGGPVAETPGLPEATEIMTWSEKKDKKHPGKSISVGLKDGRVVGKAASGL